MESKEVDEIDILHGVDVPKRKEDLVSDSNEPSKQLYHDDTRMYNMTDVELANAMDREISEYTEDFPANFPHEKFDSVSIEITPCQTEDLEMDYMRCRTNQNMTNEEEEEGWSNSHTHPVALNIPAQLSGNKRDSHNAPAPKVKVTIDEKQEPSALPDPKRSILSPISRRSVQIKPDFASIRMSEEEKSSILQTEDSWIRVAIPYLPFRVAVLCLLMNIVIPGSGTLVSGFCILCCARPRVPPKYDQDFVLLLCTNTLVGLAQLFTVTFLLVGWFWSVAWGIRMITLSFEYKQKLREERVVRLKERAINAFKSKR